MTPPLILHRRTTAHRQRGAVTLATALAVVLMIAAAVVSLLGTAGSSVTHSADAEKQVAALFLAESAVERAQGLIAQSLTNAGGYTHATCTSLAGTTTALGRGALRYDSAESVPPICSGSTCNECNLVVSGEIGETRRRVRAQLQTTVNQGVTGHADTFTLRMNTQRSGGAAFTNLAYRATATLPTDVSSNAGVGSCVNTGGSCDLTGNGWDLQRSGTNNVSSMGVFAPVNATGDLAFTTTLVTNSGQATARNYVQTGIFFYPYTAGTPVSFTGRYAQPTGNAATASTSGTAGVLPGAWNCGGDFVTAAQSDTLVYGFSSKPAVARQLDGVRFGVIPMRRMVSLTGAEGDFLYSQIWFTWNPAYSTTAKSAGAGTTLTLTPTPAPSALPAVGTTLGIASGTGAFGTTDFTGSISGKVLTVTAIPAGSTLQIGDALFGRQLAPGVRVTSRLSGTGGAGSTFGVCTLTPSDTCAGQEAPSGAITARVGVVSNAANGTIEVSRAPTTALKDATVCGGICALMYGASGAPTLKFDLSNINAGDDWASGFACLSGVDPSAVQVLGSTQLKRSYWTEPVQ